ncbi:styrene monooxygenase/indole monooxygenase family protein [Actinoalloteichus hymeniacidonis]|uniref:2-polyprenyl-6-methoxyphenol hydroxylase-like oxidoreductase n=1 Tax=Actinoalloteichus hymeniacidonis TaxID=340345 RepID=A0AAC9MYY9_9PSEU|nr:styrene monooxygenase/indole monooxygenase family protein [Actinoalloteichus hymeniacidonis]AOS63376.1 2-polyprenyl-6-methoxyphenol hydroxylase-like oxidoreductase [Actinoalloteichus hymeniacidonis]MBB5908584.1 2-polyprenyl-6-methoxyphenol hydroxylase-like FAD-dependent oxidoreductase [Actinoalloteichus hymeniacidonis]
MRKVLIVGAGQAGLQLGLSLLAHGYAVTIMSARTPEELRAGRVMSTQCMFGPALEKERTYELNLWEEDAPDITGLGVSVAGPDGGRALDWLAPTAEFAQSVDQRIKMAGWLELFEDRGGTVVFHGVTTSDLHALARLYDLVVIAAGKGELVQLFDRDPRYSPFTSPQRALSVAYVHGLGPRPEHPETTAVRFNAVPGVGELFVIPGLTLTGPCDILFFEGVPGGPLDCWQDRPGPQEHLRRMLAKIREYVPWEYGRCGAVELTDDRATLAGGYTPVVRRPIGTLPGGALVLGMADVVVANDPITGQGSNNASRCAASYLDSIVEHGERPFDQSWMQQTFDRYWSEARHATTWTNMMLHPPAHVPEVLGAAAERPSVATRFVAGFSEPAGLDEWFFDPEAARAYLAAEASAQPV